MTRGVKTLDRRALFASGAAAALLAATGVSAASRPAPGGRLRMAVSGAQRTDSFDTRNPMGLFMQIATQGAVFDTLTEVAADGTLHGELSIGWRADSDARRWVFDLRRDVAFHNGASFSAGDVVASLTRHLRDHLAGVSSISAADAHRVVFDLLGPDPHLPFRLSRPEFVIYPAQQIGQAIGTGLYKVTKFDAGRQFIGTRVGAHYKDGSAGWFDQVELVSLTAPAVRAEALRDRLVDVADLETATDLQDQADILLLPNAHAMTHAVWGDVGLPMRLGSDYPMDNLRAPERWWKG